ncbi:MAG TPA: hypothetical protein VGY54_16070 [Polyangiaceae bacterium]|jgi:hypothetical protein|nr:hypothetical protein [Polyangiaceae bacterium]
MQNREWDEDGRTIGAEQTQRIGLSKSLITRRTQPKKLVTGKKHIELLNSCFSRNLLKSDASKEEQVAMSKLRVAGFSISLDGYGAGPNQRLEHPLGENGTELHQWLFETPDRHPALARSGIDGGSCGGLSPEAEKGSDEPQRSSD